MQAQVAEGSKGPAVLQTTGLFGGVTKGQPYRGEDGQREFPSSGLRCSLVVKLSNEWTICVHGLLEEQTVCLLNAHEETPSASPVEEGPFERSCVPRRGPLPRQSLTRRVSKVSSISMICWMLLVTVEMTLSIRCTTPLVAWWSAFSSRAQFTVTICAEKK